jgi:hypothetical protein
MGDASASRRTDRPLRLWVALLVVVVLVAAGGAYLALRSGGSSPSVKEKEVAACQANREALRTMLTSTEPRIGSSVAKIVVAAEQTGNSDLIRGAHRTQDAMALVQGPEDTAHWPAVLAGIQLFGRTCSGLGITFHPVKN